MKHILDIGFKVLFFISLFMCAVSLIITVWLGFIGFKFLLSFAIVAITTGIICYERGVDVL